MQPGKRYLHPISININQYQSISININQYQSISININQYQSISNVCFVTMGDTPRVDCIDKSGALRRSGDLAKGVVEVIRALRAKATTAAKVTTKKKDMFRSSVVRVSRVFQGYLKSPGGNSNLSSAS